MRLAILAPLFTLLATVASAQTSPITVSPDSRSVLVQKNVGFQRWAIVQDRETRAITGNIFNPEGGAQFVYCSHQGGATYECLGSNGCAQEPCPWATLLTIDLPDTFFALSGFATPVPTPRPTAVPTPRPTAPPATGLQGLIGTWDFTFRIISSFTHRYRLRRVQPSTVGPYQILVGVDSMNDVVIASRVQDVDPGSPLPYEYAMLEDDRFLCEAYLFDQTDADRIRGVHASAFVSGGECGTFLGNDPTTGVRVSRTAAVAAVQASRPASRAIRRQKRAIRAEQRDLVAEGAQQELDGEAVRRLANALRAQRGETR